jgi:hypothetical protein
MQDDRPRINQRPSPADAGPVCQSIDWYHPGQSRTLDVGGMQITVRFVGRKGRRGRIAITAPAGAAFHALDHSPDKSNDCGTPSSL